MKRNFAIRILFWLLVTTNSFAQVVEIPDPNLRQAIREALQLPDGQPITQQRMLEITTLKASGKGITNLTGLDNATNLKHLYLAGRRGVSDISALANLIKLETLNLSGQAVSDITPLSNLVNLVYLSIEKNYVSDISPLANLVNLKELWININPISNFTAIQGLNLLEFRWDEPCDISPPLPSTTKRIENRSFPSVFQAWDRVVGLDNLTREQANVIHDLHWSPRFESIQWNITPTEPNYGIATQLAGSIDHSRQVRQRWLNQNPNMVSLYEIRLRNHFLEEAFPPDSEFWFREQDGQIVKVGSEYQFNFFNPKVQDLLIKRVLAVARCGLYDGVFFDGFSGHGAGFHARHVHPATDEEIIQAWLNIFHGVRSQVNDNFLIVINANDTKPTRYAEFINGSFMETGKDYPGGYSLPLLMKLEDTLSWNEENLREPTINCLEGEGMSIEPPDGPNNLRWMRLFTTLSLTHSDGYVLYTTGFRDLGGAHHDHLWHDFWDANLGRPIGAKAQLYQNIDGLFIREFTNGWAVYNRSGKEQAIALPRVSTGFSSNKSDITHLLPDLDGEIYLRVGKPFDLNRDGAVNVLDLIIVSQHFGTTEGDINGDGTTDILDLTLVAQQFSK